MSTSKHIDKICIAITAVMLAVTVLFMWGESIGIEVLKKTVLYESTLFDNSYVHTIDIVMDDWDTFIDGCESEEYSPCTVVVDGDKYKNIAIRAKGNTSLSTVSSLGSDRYSFKLEFDHYDDSVSLDGLDKLCLNNLIQDNTMMKDYIVYTLMNDFGVDTPLCSFAYLTVNGEDWGLYLAVEGVEDGFLERNYDSADGNLYKPDSISNGGGRGNGKDFSMDDFDFEDIDVEDLDVGNMGGGSENFPGGMGMPGQNNSGFDPNSKDNTQSSSAENNETQSGSSDRFDFDAEENTETETETDSQAAAKDRFDFDSEENGEAATESGSSEETKDRFDFDADSDSSADSSTENDKSTESGSTESEKTIPGGGTMPSMEEMSDAMGSMGGMGSDDVKLQYSDDDYDSYSNIFDSAKTDIDDEDRDRLIESLKNLNNYENLEEVLDIEEVLRYFVIHNFVCNGDSYTGSMVHNYYLYEEDGRLSMIPWDYNLAFGTFQGNDASGTVNTSIDSPVSGGSVDDRPMVGWIFSSDEYTEMYHELFAEFIEKWFTNGELEALISETADMIRPYVEKDPTKFCTSEEFEKGVTAITEFVTLRAEAVSNQLEGNNETVDTGDLSLTDMGTMNNTMGGGDMPDGGGTPGGEMDFSSFISVKDKDGNEVELSSIVGDITKLSGVTLEDGTEISLESLDMSSIAGVDFSKIVSAKDSEGNTYDLSGYTISVNMGGSVPEINTGSENSASGNFPSMPDFTKDNSEKSEASNTSGENNTEGNAADSTASDGTAMPSGENSESLQKDGNTMPEGDFSDKDFDFTDIGKNMEGIDNGNVSSGLDSENLMCYILLGASVLVLAAGIVIAKHFKHSS